MVLYEVNGVLPWTMVQHLGLDRRVYSNHSGMALITEEVVTQLKEESPASRPRAEAVLPGPGRYESEQ